MSEFPAPRTKRFSVLTTKYQADNNQEFIRTQRIDKDSNGDPFLPVPDFIQKATVTNQSKDVIWGEQSNLRKSVVRYEEPNNNNGTAQLTLYIPQNQPEEIKQALTEIKDIAKDKFGNANRSFCFDYQGENRFTQAKPSNLNN